MTDIPTAGLISLANLAQITDIGIETLSGYLDEKHDTSRPTEWRDIPDSVGQSTFIGGTLAVHVHIFTIYEHNSRRYQK